MTLEEEFENAVTRSRKLSEIPSNEALLSMYGLYKQATAGDNPGERPGGFDFKTIAKYDAWKSQEGKSKEEARKEYIELVEQLSKG